MSAWTLIHVGHCLWWLLSCRPCREWIPVYTQPRIVGLDAGFLTCESILCPTSSMFQVVLMTTWSKEVKWNSYASRERETSPSSSSPSSGTATPLNTQAINKMHQMKLMRMWFCEGWGRLLALLECDLASIKTTNQSWPSDTLTLIILMEPTLLLGVFNIRTFYCLTLQMHRNRPSIWFRLQLS